jgi:hypothetical protein
MTVRLRDVVLGVALVASLAANGVLSSRWRAASRAADATPANDARDFATPLAQAWRRPLPELGTPGEGPVALDGCQARASWLAAQIAQLGRLGELHTPPRQRFAQEAVNAELTAAFDTALAQHLPRSPRASVASECRGRLCRLVVPKAAHRAEWLARFRQSEWMGEHLHEVAVSADGILFEQHAPGSVRASDLLQQALQDFESSGSVEECQAKFQGDGTLDAQLSLEPWEGGEEADRGEAAAAPGIAVQADGALASTALGKCIDAELRRALAATTLPPRFERATLTAQFPRR